MNATIAAPISFKQFLLLLGDLLLFALALFLGITVRYGGLPAAGILNFYIYVAPFLFLLWLAGFVVFGLYDLRLAKNNARFLERFSRACGFDVVATALLFYLVPEFRLTPLLTLGAIFIPFGLFLFSWRALANTILARRAKEQVLFVGFSAEVAEIIQFLGENPQLGYTVAGIVAEKNGSADATLLKEPLLCRMLTEFRDIPEAVRNYRVQRLVISSHLKQHRTLVKSVFKIIPLGVAITDFPRFYETVTGKVPISLINEMWFLENLIGQHRPRYEFLKRILDLTLAFFAGAITLLFLPFIALATALSRPRDTWNHKKVRAREGDGIVFFRQARVGKNGKEFQFVKFRSQVLGAEKFGSLKQLAADPRSYAVGNFLRKTYIDELPQVWNIIRGEMSFVGPRPERPEFVAELEKTIPFYRMRELVLPGITGWAQINMERDASVEDAMEKIQYDLYYIKNRTIFLDLIILVKTALKLLQRSGR